MNFSLIAINCRYTHSCLSLFYVRNELLSHISGCRVTLHDFTINDPYFDTLTRLTAGNHSALFFSVYIWNADYIQRLIKDIASIKPSLPIIIGGPQISAFDEDNLPEHCTLVHGEIEGIPDSFYTDLEHGKLARNYSGGTCNSFFFPYTPEDISKTLADRNIYYEASRGCPFSCSYCLSSADKNMYTKKTALVEKELLEILRHKPKIIRFVDRTFNASSTRTLKLWEFLSEYGGKTLFHFEIAPDLFNEEMFSFLEKVKPGLFEFEIGIQSSNPETLEAIHRNTDIEKALNNIRRLMEIDSVHLHVDLILGLPFETEDTFARSFRDIFNILPHYIQMGLLKILPQAPISSKTYEYGLTHCARPPYQVLSTKWLTHQQLARYYWFGECVEAFYNTRFFRSFFTYIQKREDGYSFFSQLLDYCMDSEFFQQAKTQKLMSTILVELTCARDDFEIIQEILRYDWLRSGNRFVPENLKKESQKKQRDRLWNSMPQDYPPFYGRKTRNYFFKQSLFSTFSQKALQEIGLVEGDKRTVCFLPERENTVLQLQKTILVS